MHVFLSDSPTHKSLKLLQKIENIFFILLLLRSRLLFSLFKNCVNILLINNDVINIFYPPNSNYILSSYNSNEKNFSLKDIFTSHAQLFYTKKREKKIIIMKSLILVCRMNAINHLKITLDS